MAAFGAPEEVIERWRSSEQQPSRMPVMRANGPALGLFLAASTQWRFAGSVALPTGLDHAGVAATAAMMGVAMTPALFAKLRVMEDAALGEMMARAKRN